MLIIPAIDLKDGRCVRLKQGDMSTATVFSEDPVAMARHWAGLGAKRLHIVDLNGAIAGRPKNERVIREMIAAVGDKTAIQLGGGIRDLDAIESYLDAGVTYVIIGTAAVKNPGFLSDACYAFPGHVIAGLDAKDGKVAVEGWSKLTGHDVVDLAKKYEDYGIEALDLHRHRPRRHDERHQHRGDAQARPAAEDADHRFGRPQQPRRRAGHLPEARPRRRDRRHRRARAVRGQDRLQKAQAAANKALGKE